MIISSSRRTDIPAFHSDYFMKCIKEGNFWLPFEKEMVNLNDIDCFVFWSKNYKPMIDKGYIQELYDKGIKFYFHFTITPYEDDIETFKKDISMNELYDQFNYLKKFYGSESVIWRYDPIFITPKYNLGYHFEKFVEISENIKTSKCVVSLLSEYNKLKNKISDYYLPSYELETLIKVANNKEVEIFSCADPKWNKLENKPKQNRCIDDKLIKKLFNLDLKYEKDKTQRSKCKCTVSKDIGMYKTCKNGCVYCYAS